MKLSLTSKRLFATGGYVFGNVKLPSARCSRRPFPPKRLFTVSDLSSSWRDWQRSRSSRQADGAATIVSSGCTSLHHSGDAGAGKGMHAPCRLRGRIHFASPEAMSTDSPTEPSPNGAASPPRNLATAWQPLRSALFRSVWIATVVSNVGSWMQDVGSGWLMTSLSSSPALVALVEAADSFPVMLLALPAGALADIIDRRRLLIAVHCYLLVSAGILGVLTALGLTTICDLLDFTFALGVGNALVLPAWAAIVPELVPRAQLASAVALNSIAINVSRAVGPAIAGLIIASLGVWPVFILNALSYIGILAVLIHWRRERRRSALPAERFISAIRVGLRFVTHTRSLQVVLIRGGAFFAFASASWALFPLIVRRELGRGPEVYGLLLTCIGAGAVIGAVLLPRIRARISRDWLVSGAILLYAVAMFV